MSKARELIHELINSITIAEGMAKILKNNVVSDKQTFEDNLQRLDKVINFLEKSQKDIAELRQLVKEQGW